MSTLIGLLMVVGGLLWAISEQLEICPGNQVTWEGRCEDPGVLLTRKP